MKFPWGALFIFAVFALAIGSITQLSYCVFIPKTEASSDCHNLTFIDTVYCLNHYVESIYKYNKTKDSIVLSDNDLIKYGGDCKNWAEFYATEIQKYGYYGTTQTMQMNETNAHSIALLSHNKTYCIADQEYVITCERME